MRARDLRKTFLWDGGTTTDQVTHVSLTEAPQITSATNFTLDNPTQNMIWADKLKETPYETLEENAATLLLRFSDTTGIHFVLIEKDDWIIRYYAHFIDSLVLRGLGKAVFQKRVWNSGLEVSRGYPSKVIFSYIIPKYGIIISDEVQTILGKGFWIKLMAIAVSKGMKAALFNANTGAIGWYDAKETIDQWLKEREIAWGDTLEHRLYRFVIKSSSSLS